MGRDSVDEEFDGGAIIYDVGVISVQHLCPRTHKKRARFLV